MQRQMQGNKVRHTAGSGHIHVAKCDPAQMCWTKES